MRASGRAHITQHAAHPQSLRKCDLNVAAALHLREQRHARHALEQGQLVRAGRDKELAASLRGGARRGAQHGQHGEARRCG